jgi:hypothetical protein
MCDLRVLRRCGDGSVAGIVGIQCRKSQRGLIAQALEKGFESARFKILDSLLVCGNDGVLYAAMMEGAVRSIMSSECIYLTSYS